MVILNEQRDISYLDLVLLASPRHPLSHPSPFLLILLLNLLLHFSLVTFHRLRLLPPFFLSSPLRSSPLLFAPLLLIPLSIPSPSPLHQPNLKLQSYKSTNPRTEPASSLPSPFPTYCIQPYSIIPYPILEKEQRQRQQQQRHPQKES